MPQPKLNLVSDDHDPRPRDPRPRESGPGDLAPDDLGPGDPRPHEAPRPEPRPERGQADRRPHSDDRDESSGNDPGRDEPGRDPRGPAEPPADEPLAADLIAAITDGRIGPADLSLAARQNCVGYLVSEGFMNHEIARVLRVSERTVRRDRAALIARRSVAPETTLGDRMLGEFQERVFDSVQRLVRLARDPQTPPYARIWAEQAVVRNHRQLIETAHRLRYVDAHSGRLERQRPGAFPVPPMPDLSPPSPSLRAMLDLLGGSGRP